MNHSPAGYKRRVIVLSIVLLIQFSLQAQQPPLLQVAPNHRFFQTSNGSPFFWLGDTGWLLFHKLTRQEALHYLDTRQQQGFTVIQAMLLHSTDATNVYHQKALNQGDISSHAVSPGDDTAHYDYWDHVAFIIAAAAQRGIYMALVPIWGGDVKAGKVTPDQATRYARFLVKRFGAYHNIIWLNGGDTRGDKGTAVWNAIGNTLHQYDSTHLIGYHPRGRYSSSEWFHQASWLDFNMFQSGHRTYAQDTLSVEKNHFGEDNWRYVQHDYALKPVKPTMDGEPSYENIPYGLHDSLNPRWKAPEIRRYAYWSVFAGGAGFTYGENAVMQFHKKEEGPGSYGVTDTWDHTIYATGATQLKHLKALLLTTPYFDRVPAQELIADNDQYTRYDYIVATKGGNYAFVYTYTGRNFTLNLSKLGFTPAKVQWYSPATGETTPATFQAHQQQASFDPPGSPAAGNDWVLVLRSQ